MTSASHFVLSCFSFPLCQMDTIMATLSSCHSPGLLHCAWLAVELRWGGFVGGSGDFLCSTSGFLAAFSACSSSCTVLKGPEDKFCWCISASNAREMLCPDSPIVS
jgi:hypothetical protein